MSRVRFVRPTLILGLVAIAALAMAACSNDDDNGENPGTGDNGDPNASDAAATLDDLAIHDPWIRYTLGENAAGYFVITNEGEEDRLVEARSDVTDRVELHEVIRDGSGGTMQEVEGGIDVPADGELVFETGGYHIMLMELDELEHGQEVGLTLVFEEAGEVAIHAPVEIPGSDDAERDDGHNSHDGDDGQDGH